LHITYRTYRTYIKMIIPIRCFTCGKVIAHLWPKYLAELQQATDIIDGTTITAESGATGKSVEGKTLDKLGVHRYCCRRMILGNIDLCDKI